MKKNTLLIGLLALILNACTTVPSEAVEATFQWDRNPEEDVSSYRIEIYNDKTSTWVTLGTTDDNPTTALIDPPVILVVPNFANKLAKLRAFAINTAGLESLPSDEYIVQPVAPGRVKNFVRLGK